MKKTTTLRTQMHLKNQILSLLENGSGKMINSMISVGSGPLSYFPFPLSNWVTWDNGKTFKGMQSQSFFSEVFMDVAVVGALNYIFSDIMYRKHVRRLSLLTLRTFRRGA